MKRLTIIILVVSMMFSSLVFASETSTTNTYDNQIAFLENLNIVNKEKMAQFEAGNFATRADAAYMATKMVFNMEIGSSDQIFSDVPSSHWAANEIYYSKKSGFVNGVDTERFDPDAKITKAQAIKIILSAIGYDQMAQ